MNFSTNFKIFLVDQDSFSLDIYELYLLNLGYKDIEKFTDSNSCIESLSLLPDVVFLVQGMTDMHSLDLLKKIKAIDSSIYVVFVTFQDKIEEALEAVKLGAFDYFVRDSHDVKKIETILMKITEIKSLLSLYKDRLPK